MTRTTVRPRRVARNRPGASGGPGAHWETDALKVHGHSNEGLVNVSHRRLCRSHRAVALTATPIGRSGRQCRQTDQSTGRSSA
jgi:hypothetical protein